MIQLYSRSPKLLTSPSAVPSAKENRAVPVASFRMLILMSYTAGLVGVAPAVPKAEAKLKGVTPLADRVKRPIVSLLLDPQSVAADAIEVR